jgi:hypothetical protein
MADKSTCRLLALPAELRLRIYHDFLTPALAVNGFLCHREDVFALLCTCHQVRNEATPEYTAALDAEITSAVE